MSDALKKPANDALDEIDIRASRLSPEEYKTNFSDVYPLLDRKNAILESNRCLFCYDAPCMEACPTSIDIPGFIKKISSDNVKGAAKTILMSNIMGGSCARVCPVEELCEEACVKNAQDEKPIKIGQLQRYATDHLFDREDSQIFSRKPDTNKRVAIVGAGPAGLACAHTLSRQGHTITIYEAKEKAGGLNEYGIAAYKVANNFAQREVDYILSLGGIEIKYNHALGKDINLEDLRKSYDAVFLSIGLSAVNALRLDNETIDGVINAVDFIEQIRQSNNLETLPIGRRVVVIGGGNTAIDIAVQTKKLGADDVTLVYRRGEDDMSATWHEQDFAKLNGVNVKYWSKPVTIHERNGHVESIDFEKTSLDSQGKLVGTGQKYNLRADMIFKAIGQKYEHTPLEGGNDKIQLNQSGRIDVDASMKTSLPNVWAGGDCTDGKDLTVVAVDEGNTAAIAIHEFLMNI